METVTLKCLILCCMLALCVNCATFSSNCLAQCYSLKTKNANCVCFRRFASIQDLCRTDFEESRDAVRVQWFVLSSLQAFGFQVKSRIPCLTESINSEQPVSSLKCVSVKENWFSVIEVDRAAWSNPPYVQHLSPRSLLRVCGRIRAAFTLQCFCAGGKSRSSLHAAVFHLCCAGSGAVW